MDHVFKGLTLTSYFLIKLFIVTLTLPSTGNAQQGYQKKTFTQDNGLSHTSIQSIARDSTGFLWIATWDGLNRFDGFEFRNYYHKPEDTASFPFFIPSKVVIDSKNNVWIFTRERHAVLYDRANDSFMPIFPEIAKNYIPGDIITDREGNILMTLDTSLCKIDPERKILTSFRIIGDNESLAKRGAKPQIDIDNKNKVWLYYNDSMGYQVYKGDLHDDKSLRMKFAGTLYTVKYESSKILNELGNFDFFTDGEGTTWLFSKYGLFKFNENDKSFTETREIPDPGHFSGKRWYVWTNDETGINIIDSNSKSHINILPDDGSYTESVFVDNSGTVWSGTINASRVGSGLNRYRKIPEYFRHYLTGINESGSINLVFPIARDRFNHIWIGTRYHDHLIRIGADGNIKKIDYLSPSVSGKPSIATCFATDNYGIWIGTSGGELVFYDFKSEKAEQRYPSVTKGIGEMRLIHNIINDSVEIIINENKGIYKFYPGPDSIRLCYRHVPEGSGFTLVSDGKSGFWLGTFGNRIIHLDSNLTKRTEFKIGVENNIVEHICPGDSQDVWIALMGGGLGHLYPENGQIEIFTREHGLSNDVTYSIVKDGSGKLWISTNTGISRFDPESRNFTRYSELQGLLINEFNSDSWFRADDGEIFFGGVGGAVSFHPGQVISDNSNYVSSLFFNDFKVSGINRYFDRPVYESDTIILDKRDNNFQVTLFFTDLENSGNKTFRYRIKGVDKGWIECDSKERNISYANLTSNDYILEAEVFNENGECAGRAALLVIIPNSITETFWFRLGIALFALSGFVIAGINYFRQTRLREKQVRDELKLESLRGQMNPHFIFNSLSSINYFISREDKLSANNYIADFSRLIRSILGNMLNDYIPFEKELESIRDYLKLEHLRFGDKFDYELNTEDIPADREISVFPGMVQPFIENAIWHGLRGLEDRKGILNIQFFFSENSGIKCVITDDGIGRKLAEMYSSKMPGHKSRGIEIVRERLRIFNEMTNKNCQVSITDLSPDKEEKGTKVTIDLPAVINEIH